MLCNTLSSSAISTFYNIVMQVFPKISVCILHLSNKSGNYSYQIARFNQLFNFQILGFLLCDG
ncbi:hypothetical protein Hanom_Chr06g00512931 [Helianthus anomalus]